MAAEAEPGRNPMAKKITTYIAMLRGINVSGQKPVKMPALAAMFESLGYTGAVTYIQSGNVVFRSASSGGSSIAQHIEAGIKKEFGYDVPVIVRRSDELESIIRSCPFVGRSSTDTARLYVTFLSAAPSQEATKKILSVPLKTSDEFIISGDEVFLHCPNGYGNTQLSNTFFEKFLNVRATTRNWNTVNTLYAMSLEVTHEKEIKSSPV
jgi:uncharacterized protein (DUF1697 family)